MKDDKCKLPHRLSLLAVLVIGWLFSWHSHATTVGILVWDGVLSSDVTAPMEVFGAASRKSWFEKFEVKLIALDGKSVITTEEGIKLGVDAGLQNAPNLDALIVPSSYDMEALLNNVALIDFIRQRDQQVKYMASNCSGAFLLAQAGLLDGVKATTWAGGESDLQKQFPAVKVVEATAVVSDGRYITSNGSIVSYVSALTLLQRLSSERQAKEIFEALQIGQLTPWQQIRGFVEG